MAEDFIWIMETDRNSLVEQQEVIGWGQSSSILKDDHYTGLR